MELNTALLLGVGLFLLVLAPYVVYEIRRGKKHGHTWFTRFKPRGHSDVAPADEVERTIRPHIDEARGSRQ